MNILHTAYLDSSRRRAPRTPMFFFVVFLGLCTLVTPVCAKGDADGLEKSLKSGKKVINFSGKEGDDIRIPKNVTVIGVNPSQAVINGDVSMENGAVLKNVTINAKLIGVTVAKGASVTLDNVVVRGAADIGVFAKEGGGTLTVKNSKILQNRKGFYILPGKNLLLTNNDVTRNKEEGLDVRWGVSGSISGNRFTQNGEGGAEIIVGGASLVMSANTFAANKASGLSLQFYADAKKSGQMNVTTNTFSGNGNFGVSCGNPSGGTPPPHFFKNAVRLSGNILSGNKGGSIHPSCNVANALPQKIKEEAPASETGEQIMVTPESREGAFEKNTSAEKEYAADRLQQVTAALAEEVAAIGFFQRWSHSFFGTDREYFLAMQARVTDLQRQIFLLSVCTETDRDRVTNELVLRRVLVVQEELAALSQALAGQ